VRRDRSHWFARVQNSCSVQFSSCDANKDLLRFDHHRAAVKLRVIRQCIPMLFCARETSEVAVVVPPASEVSCGTIRVIRQIVVLIIRCKTHPVVIEAAFLTCIIDAKR